MSRSMRLSSSWLLVFLLSLGFFAATPAEADHFRGGKIEWCWGPPADAEHSLSTYVSFQITASYRRWAGQNVGDTVVEVFDFGDGTSQLIGLTVTQVFPGSGPGDDGWFIAGGSIFSHHYPSTTYYSAGVESCCRIDGTGGPALNNRNNGDYTVKAQVYADEEYCSPDAGFPAVVWLSGGLGDTFQIPLPVDAGPQDSFGFELVFCRFASDAEAGGGNNPDGMTIDPATCEITWNPTSGDPARLWTTQVQAEYYISYGDFLVASTPIDFLLGLDAVRPACVLESTVAGPPTKINVRAQDPRSGIATVQVLESLNATVQVPPFTPGTTGSLAITGTKIDQSKGSRIRLRITDQAGNATECDPVLAEVGRETGKPESQTFEGVPPEERAVTVYNGSPGLRHLHVEVNGRRYQMNNLAPGEERTLDVGAAVQEGQTSTFTLTPHGKPGGSAVVMIWDGLR